MSREDRASRILQAAGVEAAQRRPAQVIAMPVRSAFLAATAQPAKVSPVEEPRPEVPDGKRVWPEWVGWAIRGSKYLGFACAALSILMAISWVRETLILADVGRATCSTLKVSDTPEAQVYWTEEDPASTVPRLRTQQFVACMKAGSPF